MLTRKERRWKSEFRGDGSGYALEPSGDPLKCRWNPKLLLLYLVDLPDVLVALQIALHLLAGYFQRTGEAAVIVTSHVLLFSSFKNDIFTPYNFWLYFIACFSSLLSPCLFLLYTEFTTYTIIFTFMQKARPCTQFEWTVVSCENSQLILTRIIWRIDVRI